MHVHVEGEVDSFDLTIVLQNWSICHNNFHYRLTHYVLPKLMIANNITKKPWYCTQLSKEKLTHFVRRDIYSAQYKYCPLIQSAHNDHDRVKLSEIKKLFVIKCIGIDRKLYFRACNNLSVLIIHFILCLFIWHLTHVLK